MATWDDTCAAEPLGQALAWELITYFGKHVLAQHAIRIRAEERGRIIQVGGTECTVVLAFHLPCDDLTIHGRLMVRHYDSDTYGLFFYLAGRLVKTIMCRLDRVNPCEEFVNRYADVLGRLALRELKGIVGDVWLRRASRLAIPLKSHRESEVASGGGRRERGGS